MSQEANAVAYEDFSGPPLTLPTPNVLDVFSQLGNPDTGACAAFPGLIVSKYFAPNREERVATYGEIYDAIMKMAAVYRGRGLGLGSKIALAETNGLDFFSSYFGGLAVGAAMVPINLLALQDESSKATSLAHMLSTPRLTESAPAGANLFVLGEDTLFEKMRGLAQILKIKRLGPVFALIQGAIQRFAQGHENPTGLDALVFKALGKKAKTPREKADMGVFFAQLPPKMAMLLPEAKQQALSRVQPLKAGQLPVLKPTAIADILYTSGTSGNPKGVALTHENLAFTVASLTQGTEGVIHHDEVLLMGLPFFHIFGKAVMLTALSKQLTFCQEMGDKARVKMVLLPSLSKAITNLDGVIKTIEDYGVTLMPMVPIFLEKLVEYLQRHPQKQAQVQTLRVMISGGAALKRETVEAFQQIVPHCRVMEGYGSSEGGINLLNSKATPGFVGHPMPGVDIRLVQDLASESSDAAETVPGELWVRSPGVSMAYVTGTTSGSDTQIVDADGWFKTGDMVLWDAVSGHSQGVKIVGRQSFFIKIDNEKRSPQEIEQAVMLAHPDLLEVLAISYLPGTPDEQAIAVAMIADADVDEAVLKKAMDQLAQKNQITRWKIPKHIVVLHVEEPPARLNNGFKREAGYKVARQLVQQLLAPGPNGTPPAMVFHSRSETVKREWTEVISEAQVQAILKAYQS